MIPETRDAPAMLGRWPFKVGAGQICACPSTSARPSLPEVVEPVPVNGGPRCDDGSGPVDGPVHAPCFSWPPITDLQPPSTTPVETHSFRSPNRGRSIHARWFPKWAMFLSASGQRPACLASFPMTRPRRPRSSWLRRIFPHCAARSLPGPWKALAMSKMCCLARKPCRIRHGWHLLGRGLCRSPDMCTENGRRTRKPGRPFPNFIRAPVDISVAVGIDVWIGRR